MGGADVGPDVIESIAVTAEDVVAAAARQQLGGSVVLRVTPPFSGRMRARLHVQSEADADAAPEAVHVEPADLLDGAAPAYPRPADTEGALRADPSITYTTDRHHERHRRAVADWRAAARDHVVDETVIETPTGNCTIDVLVVG